MSIFAKTRSTQDGFLALDLGTDTIKSLLATLDRTKQTEELALLASAQITQETAALAPGEIQNYQELLASCRQALAQVRAAAEVVDSKDVVIGLSGEAVFDQISTVRYSRPNPNAPLTKAELDLFFKRIEKSKEEAHPESRLINALPLEIVIDGYRALNPVGFKGEELVVRYLTTFAPYTLVNGLRKLCDELDLYPLAIVSSAYALARACLGPSGDPELSALIIDSGAGTTKLTLLDAGDFIASTSFEIGGKNLTHQIAKTLKVPEATAEFNKLHLDDEATLSDEEVGETSAALAKGLKVWAAALGLALEELSSYVDYLPSSIILTGGSAQLSPLRDVLANLDWAETFGSVTETPELHYLQAGDLPGFAQLNEEIDPLLIPALALLRVGADLRRQPER